MKSKLVKYTLFPVLVLMLAVGVNPVLAASPSVRLKFEKESVLPVSPTPAPTPQSTGSETSKVDHELVPTEGSGKEQIIHDQVNTTTADEKRAFGGESYYYGRFERPFDADMNYLPYLDIMMSSMQREDEDFIYVKIQVTAPVSDAEDNPALYGLKIDLNRDGRSEFLILAERPVDSEWSVNGVNVWKSSSAELAEAPEGPAIPVTGSLGYDVSLFAAGVGDDADLAWVRLVPETEDVVEIAFKNTLVGGEKGTFIWRPVTDGAPYPTTIYDLNVNFPIDQAGSPLRDSMFYPLKEVYAVDNTCRVASGFTPTGKEPGLCPLPPPPERSDKPVPGTPPNIQTPLF